MFKIFHFACGPEVFIEMRLTGKFSYFNTVISLNQNTWHVNFKHLIINDFNKKY